jgi:hypothetical protein
MKKIILPILTISFALFTSTSAKAVNLTVGNLVVERVGVGGATPLASTAQNVAVLEFTTSGTAVQTITFPTTGADQMTDSGSATSNGNLNSYNGLVAVTGYNSPVGTTGVASSNTKVTSVLDNTGAVVNRTTYPTGGPTGTPVSPFSGNNLRSAIATGSNTFYASGTASLTPNTGGVWYSDGASFTQVSSTATGQPTNMRNVEIYNGQLFSSSGASTGYGIFSIGTGLPTSAGSTSTLAINTAGTGTGNASPYGFVMFDTNKDSLLDTAFIADDRTSAGGGLQKWTLSGAAWVNSYALLFNTVGGLTATAGSGIVGIRGLTGSYDDSTGAFNLFATTTDASNNRIVSVVDNGTTPTTFTTLASAGTNLAFRGIDIMSVPEPSSATLLGLGFLALLGVRRLNRKV